MSKLSILGIIVIVISIIGSIAKQANESNSPPPKESTMTMLETLRAQQGVPAPVAVPVNAPARIAK